ncbi:ras-domain-containing protein [Ascodesmis nigricans]|uniref:Ras-domain-containing protein n=1 Tax=Ascodesmis nigricans TaxID=341454 RepID=A0A4S2N7A1_9PEZI|nr:ras-domain-containing protein [Ascodesmis nigricans]
MVRQRAPSGASSTSSHSASATSEQELGTMYDYLAKIILLGPSGCGKSCLLHRFVRNEWRVLSSQTIGVEFSSRIIKVGARPHQKRIKLQLWDTAGQERFRSVTRSYYRGAAGALLVYDITSHPSFAALPTFLADARALASPNLTVILVGNKADLERPPAVGDGRGRGGGDQSSAASSFSVATQSSNPWREEYTDRERDRDRDRDHGPSSTASSTAYSTRNNTYNHNYSYTNSSYPPSFLEDDEPTRAVSTLEATRWASLSGIPVSMETSALNGDNVDEVFTRLARMIVTKIELGEVDPDDPASGIQYGDGGGWVEARNVGRREQDGWKRSLREWESVFRKDGGRGGRGGRCC